MENIDENFIYQMDLDLELVEEKIIKMEKKMKYIETTTVLLVCFIAFVLIKK